MATRTVQHLQHNPSLPALPSPPLAALSSPDFPHLTAGAELDGGDLVSFVVVKSFQVNWVFLNEKPELATVESVYCVIIHEGHRWTDTPMVQQICWVSI